MKKYEVVGPAVQLHSGLVFLSRDQAADRSHILKSTPVKDCYELLAPTYFKYGEVFGYDGEVSPSMALELQDAGTGNPATPVRANTPTHAVKKPKPPKPLKEPKKSNQKPKVKAISAGDDGDGKSDNDESSVTTDDSGDAA